ncbi:hypothetical protein D3C76_486790 [compost metagenome]
MSDEALPAMVGNDSEGFVDVLEAERDLVQGKAQLESLLNATDALESLISHLDRNEVVTPGHKAAITVSFENLIGNAGLTVADIVPELEGHENGTVSTESLKDRLKELWKRLVSAILSVLKSLRGFWSKISTYRGRLRISAEHLAKHAAVRRYGTVRKPMIELGLEIKSLVSGNSVMSDPDAIIRSISAALDQYKIFTEAYGPGMLEIGKQFERMLSEGSTGSNKLNEVSNLFASMPVDQIASKMKAMVYRDPRFGRRLTLTAPPIIGGWSLFFLTLEPEQRSLAASNPLAYAQAVRTTGVRFAMTNVNTSSINSGSVKAAGGMQVELLAKRVIEIIDVVEAQDRAIGFGRIEAQIKNVLRAGERYQATASSYGDSAGMDESVLRFVRNYAGWAIGPVDQMTTNLLTVSRNLLTYGRKSLTAQ